MLFIALLCIVLAILLLLCAIVSASWVWLWAALLAIFVGFHVVIKDIHTTLDSEKDYEEPGDDPRFLCVASPASTSV